MKGALRKYLGKADTPTKRVGVIFIGLALAGWLGAAVHWNLLRTPFFYSETRWTEWTPKPAESANGTYWRETALGWTLYNRACTEQTKSDQNFYTANMKCQIRFIPHQAVYRTEWKTSFESFVDELFDARRGDYYLINLVSWIAILLGFLVFFGLLDKAVRWVKTGTKSP
jgi:hypothetical protein